MTETAELPPRPSALNRLVSAFIVAAAYGFALYLLIWLPDSDELPFIGGLFLLPAAVASVLTAIADPRGEGQLWPHIRNGWIAIGALVVLSVILFQEGGICVAMAAPCFLVGSTVGSSITLVMLRHLRSRRACSLVIVLPLIGLPVERNLSYPNHHGAVTTEIEIAASPAAVWRHTVEIPRIDSAELPPSFSHTLVGVPRPVDAVMHGEGVGAVRQLRWTKGVHFQEIVSAWEQDRHLAWNFRFASDSIPPDVEAHIDVDSTYLTLADGEYRLEPIGNGGTRLVLTTRYRIATPINAYCDLWGRIFLNDFHRAVLTVIKARAEASAPPA